MKKISVRDKTFLILIGIMLVIKLFDIIFSPNHIYPGRIASFSWIEIALAFILGYIGIRISDKVGIPSMWDPKVSNKNRFLLPIVVGILIGVIFITFDYYAKIGNMSVGFPLSILFYLWGGIYSEAVLHLFPVTLLVFLFSSKLLKGRYNKEVYWIFSVLLGLTSAFGMVMAFSIPGVPIHASSVYVIYSIGFLIFITELTVLYILRKYGFLSAISTRLSFYLIWHIIWPLIFY
ncbi:MAG: hypothetical protein HPY60_06455 [Candidatus Methanofastidiosum sp.]|nr:hypothetical protein [Methanofastidiosum sp.]